MAPSIIICKDCGKERPLEAHGLCKQCYQAQYYSNRREQRHMYYVENRKKILMQISEWRKENKEHLDEYNSKYRAENTEAHRESNRKWEEQNPDYKRDYHLRYTYGISLEDYDEILEAQNGRCAICGMDTAEHGRRLFVDHDHETEKVRGLLCRNCNMMLGHAHDNIGVLLNAIDYLRGK